MEKHMETKVDGLLEALDEIQRGLDELIAILTARTPALGAALAARQVVS